LVPQPAANPRAFTTIVFIDTEDRRRKKQKKQRVASRKKPEREGIMNEE
jgi:hypothetical protein